MLSGLAVCEETSSSVPSDQELNILNRYLRCTAYGKIGNL
jgi:hypothetical protein